MQRRRGRLNFVARTQLLLRIVREAALQSGQRIASPLPRRHSDSLWHFMVYQRGETFALISSETR
jgi:hypothetical protein